MVPSQSKTTTVEKLNRGTYLSPNLKRFLYIVCCLAKALRNSAAKKPDASTAPAVTNVTDTIDTTIIKLTACETVAEGGTVTYTAMVAAPVTGSPAVVTREVLNIRRRPPYNCRHTYATMCIMSGMNPAFISQQLGRSVRMLLSTYARWINSSSDWSEMQKLQIGPKLVPVQISAP
jgi:hypothetical protein